MAKRKSGRYDFDEWDLPDHILEEENRHKPDTTRNEPDMDWAGYAEEDFAPRRNQSRRTNNSSRNGRRSGGGGKKLLLGLAAVAASVCLIVGIGLMDNPSDRKTRKDDGVRSFPQVLDVPENTTQEDPDPPEQQFTSEPDWETTDPGTQTPPVEPAPNVEPREYRFHARKLNESEKQAYDVVVEGLQAQEVTIEGVPFSTEESIGRVMEAIFLDNAELYWYTGAYSYVYYDRNGHLDVTLTPTYNCTPAERAQRQALVESKIKGLVDELQGKSEYEKVKGVYEFLIDYTAYDYAYMDQTLYELLSDGRAVCAAYARAMQFILTRLDVETIYVSGDAGSPENKGSHAWNIVKIDGDYYQIDATWGDPYSEDGTQTKNFIYFCVTDAEMGRDHWPEKTGYPPCTATKYNYFVYEGRFLDTYNEELLKQWLRESEMRGEPLEFRMANKQLYQEVKKKLIDEGEMFRLFEDVLGKSVQYYYSWNDNFYILTISW